MFPIILGILVCATAWWASFTMQEIEWTVAIKQPDHISYELWILGAEEMDHPSKTTPFADCANSADSNRELSDGEIILVNGMNYYDQEPWANAIFQYKRSEIPLLDAAYCKWQELRQNSPTPYKDYAQWWRAHTKEKDIKLYCSYCMRVQYSQLEIAKWDSTVDAYRQWQKILHESRTPFVDYAQWWHKFKKTNDVEVYGPYGCLFSYNDAKLPELEGEWRSFGSNIADLCRLKDEAAYHMHHRVNNLANLEALLNIVANVIEILGILCGGYRLLDGFMHLIFSWRSADLSARSRSIKLASKKGFIGICIIMTGLAAPGVINWLVASARDANLFS